MNENQTSVINLKMDSEAGGLLTSSAFDEANVRRGFMRKVYSILSLQLLVTMAVMGIFFIEPVKIYSRTDGQWMFWVAFVASMVCIIALTCFEGVRRKAPGNMVWLGVFTLGKISQVFKFFTRIYSKCWPFFSVEGVMLGCAVTAFSADEVLMAVGITVVLVLGLTLFALQTKIDFTACGAALLMMVLCLMLFGLCIWFFPNNKIVNIVYASLGAFIFR